MIVVAPMYGMTAPSTDIRCQTTWNTLQGWSDCLRIEIAPLGVDVVLVEPGFDSDCSTASVAGNDAGPLANGAETSDSPVAEMGLVAAVIRHAIRACRPKARYAIGRLANSLVLTRKWLGEGMFDRLMTN